MSKQHAQLGEQLLAVINEEYAHLFSAIGVERIVNVGKQCGINEIRRVGNGFAVEYGKLTATTIRPLNLDILVDAYNWLREYCKEFYWSSIDLVGGTHLKVLFPIGTQSTIEAQNENTPFVFLKQELTLANEDLRAFYIEDNERLKCLHGKDNVAIFSITSGAYLDVENARTTHYKLENLL